MKCLLLQNSLCKTRSVLMGHILRGPVTQSIARQTDRMTDKPISLALLRMSVPNNTMKLRGFFKLILRFRRISMLAITTFLSFLLSYIHHKYTVPKGKNAISNSIIKWILWFCMPTIRVFGWSNNNDLFIIAVPIRSCQEYFRRCHANVDGIYTIYNVDGGETRAYCDMTKDGGGWTLLVTSKSKAGWDIKNVLLR